MFIFSYFLTFFQKSIQLDSMSQVTSSYTAIINAIQTAVIDQFIAIKTEKWILSEANQNKIVFSCWILQISIIWSFTNINRMFGQWILFINYYKLRYYI